MCSSLNWWPSLEVNKMCWTGFTCLWSGYLQWKWNNENSPSEESHFFTALPGCNTARRAGQEQNGVCQVRFKLDLLSLARCNHHTGVFVPAEVQVRQWELSEGRKVFLFQLCDWGQPVLYRAHSPHLHSPTALNYPLRFLRETEWQLSLVQQWERGGSRGLAEKSIHKWINCTNNFS